MLEIIIQNAVVKRQVDVSKYNLNHKSYFKAFSGVFKGQIKT